VSETMSEKEREFPFTKVHFETIRSLIYQQAGINLSDSKLDMVYSRLVRRLRVHRLLDFDSYLHLLAQESNGEMVHFINALTTNLTAFFREQHHFDYLTATVFPHLEQLGERRIRIWSAGCSTGEESYSIAMTAADYFQNKHGWDIKIYATDLDTNVVRTGQQGIYAEDRVKDLDPASLKRYFYKGKGNNSGMVRVKPQLQQMIEFHPLNLLEQWPFRELFDVVFCRNVVIYFNKDTQKVLFKRFADIMNTSAYLFIGHSESMHNVSNDFRLVGQTIHEKIS
jgi:chemotaxis protein methyltransferase CheR